MKSQTKYVQLLEQDLEFMRAQLAAERKDIEFYRGKVERLELSIMSNAAIGAQLDYAASTRDDVSRAPVTPPKWEQAARHVPFSEIRRRWNAMSQEEQEKAVELGTMDLPKEDDNAGSK